MIPFIALVAYVAGLIHGWAIFRKPPVKRHLASPAVPTDAKPEDDPTALWAVIHRLQAALKGPAGYVTWQDAATAERLRRVKAEKALSDAAQSVRDALEQAAKLADSFGPSRPLFQHQPTPLVRGRWEGEQAASVEIANRIRALIQSPSVRDAAQPMAPVKDSQ